MRAFRLQLLTAWPRVLASVLIAFSALLGPVSRAQITGDTLTLIVPYPPGGSGDASGRLRAEEVGKAPHKSVIVDNRPGASGVIALTVTARSAPNGQTMMLATNGPLVLNMALMDKMPLDVEKDVRPIAMVGAQSMIVVARDDAPYNDMQELVRYAHANPGKINRGAVGNSGITHLGFARFEKKQGFVTTLVPYKGDAPAQTDLMGRTLDIYVGGGNTIRQTIASGRLKGLAVMGPQRFADLPSVRTMKEQGYPDSDAIAWFSIAVPSATPPAIAAELTTAFNKVTSDPAVLKRMADLGIDPFTLDLAGTTRYVGEERKRWIPLIHELGIKAE